MAKEIQFNVEMAQAFSAESFWEFLRGNSTISECELEINSNGLDITQTEIRAARMENRAAKAYYNGDVVLLVQPY